MGRSSKFLTDKVLFEAKAGLKRLGKQGVIAGKLQIIIAAKAHGITDVCRIHGISRSTVTIWIKQLFEGGKVEKLANKGKRANSPLAQHLDIIREWVEADSNITGKALRIRIKEVLKIDISKSSIYRVLNKLKFSYITPRPRHYKQDKTTHEGFKKK